MSEHEGAAPGTDPVLESMSGDEMVELVRQSAGALRDEIGKVIVGQQTVVDLTLIALFADGHVLLEGVPGLGKTLLVRTLADTLSLPFARIQFTPDVMPADITGTSVVVEASVPIQSSPRNSGWPESWTGAAAPATSS